MGMSGMANEMAARIEADGGQGLPDGAGVPPGSRNGDQQGTQPAPPPAGESNTDTGAGGTPPDTIPYARFKEVNDQLGELKGFQTLREYGYDPDSLGRLAAFEAQYQQDPVGTIHHMVTNLDLPADVKTGFEQLLREHKLLEGGDSAAAEGTPSGDGTASPALPPEVQKKLDYVDQLQAREEEARNNAVLDDVMAAWKSMDTQDKVQSPSDRAMLLNISAALQNGKFASVEEVARAAREPFVEYRTTVLGDAVQGTGRGGLAPAPLPGSAPVPAGPVRFRSFADASKAAKEAIERGELPTLPGA